MAASAGQVFTGVSGGRGDNSGRAAVLDSAPDFNADVFYQRLYERQRQEKLDAAKAAKDQQKAWADLSLEMPDVWSVDSPYLEKQLLDYDEAVTEMKMNGSDPENLYTPEGKDIKKRAIEMEKTRALIGENEAFYKDLVGKISNDKAGQFDKAYATDFIKRFTDPKLSPQDRAKMRMEENPFRLNVTETDFIKMALPEETQQGRTTFRDPESFEVMATDIVSSPNGQLMYESLKKDGEDQDAFVKRMRGQFEQMYRPSVKPAPQGGGGSGGSGGEAESVDLQVTSSYNPAFPTEKGKTNTLTFTPKNQNMKPVVLFDGQTQYVAAGQLSIHPSADGSSYVVEADVYDEAPETQKIDPQTGNPVEKTNSELLVEMMNKGSKKKRMTFPIDHRAGFFGNENYQILSDRSPKEIQKYLGQNVGGAKTESKGAVKAQPKKDASGQPILRGKMKGTWYVWDENTGTYIPE